MNNRTYFEEIRLHNFMCHSDTVLRLTNGFNLLVGRNGVGKSAFVEALQFLSGTRKPGDRYPSWDKLVQHNESEMRVTATLNCRGRKQNIEHLYRKKIGMKKAVSRYYINGKKVTCAQVKQTLKGENLILWSPLMAIKQAWVSRLVSNLTPETITELLEEASGVDKYRKKWEDVNQKISNLHPSLGALKNEVKRIERQTTRCKEEQRIFNRAQSFQQQLVSLEAKANYHRFLELREEWERNDEILDQIAKKLQNLWENRNRLEMFLEILLSASQLRDSSYSQIKDQVRKLDSQLTGINARMQTCSETIRKIMVTSRIFIEPEFASGIHSFLSELADSLKKDMEALEAKLPRSEPIKREITKYRNLSLEADNVWKQLVCLKDELFAIFQDSLPPGVLFPLQEFIGTSSNNYSMREISLSEFVSLLAEFENQLKISIEIREEIVRLRREGPEAFLPRVVAQILRVIRREKINASGPIALEVGFTSPDMEKAARFQFSDQVWYSFLVFDRDSREKLRKIRRKSRQFQIALVRGSRPIKKGVRVSSKLGRMIDGIKADPVVKEFLYTKCGNILVAETQSEADALLKRDKVRVLTLEGVDHQSTDIHETEFQRYYSKARLGNSLEQEQVLRKALESLPTSDDLLFDKNRLEKVKSLRRKLEIFWSLAVNYGGILSELFSLTPAIEPWNEIDQTIHQRIPYQEALNSLLLPLKEIAKAQNGLQDEREYQSLLTQELVAVKVDAQELEKEKLLVNQRIMACHQRISDISSRIKELYNQRERLRDDRLNDQSEFEHLKRNLSGEQPCLSKEEIDRRRIKIQGELSRLAAPETSQETMLLSLGKKLARIKRSVQREEKKLIALRKRQKDFQKQWNVKMTEVVEKTEDGIRQILKRHKDQVGIDIVLDWKTKSTGGIVELAITGPDGIPSTTYELSPGQASFVATTILLGLLAILPPGGFRILDEFDQSLDRINTKFLRDEIRSQADNTQYLVISPGKFPELGVGANLIRVEMNLPDTDIQVFQGWPIAQEETVA